MKKIIIAVIVFTTLGCIFYIDKKMADEAYASCVSAGVQSDETCYFYAYIR